MGLESKGKKKNKEKKKTRCHTLKKGLKITFTLPDGNLGLIHVIYKPCQEQKRAEVIISSLKIWINLPTTWGYGRERNAASAVLSALLFSWMAFLLEKS